MRDAAQCYRVLEDLSSMLLLRKPRSEGYIG